MGRAGEDVVIFSGGGTGGHLYPALALADALTRVRPGVRPFFVGASRGIEARVLPRKGAEHVLLPVEGFRRGEWSRNRSVVPNLLRSLATVMDLFQALRPRLTVVTGGYAGGPAGLVAALLGVPLALQEQNAVPGITTRALSRAAAQIHLAFPEARERLPASVRPRCIVSGNPVRPPRTVDTEAARSAFGLPLAGPVLLVVGGSQGSVALNRVVMELAEGVESGILDRPGDVACLWSTGPTHHEEVQARLMELGSPSWIRAVPYIEEMPEALALGTLAVSRAGAMATSEFLAWGLPAVLVPLPTSASDHQRENAVALEEAGAAIALEEAGLTGSGLWDAVRPVLQDPEMRETMARRARERGRPGAARDIAMHLARLLGPGGGVAA